MTTAPGGQLLDGYRAGQMARHLDDLEQPSAGGITDGPIWQALRELRVALSQGVKREGPSVYREFLAGYSSTDYSVAAGIVPQPTSDAGQGA